MDVFSLRDFVVGEYIDRNGKITIPSRFRSARSFCEGLAAVEEKRTNHLETRWGYIDRKGDFAIAPVFETAEDFSEGLAPVRQDGLVHYFIGRSGKPAMQRRFSRAEPFRGGVARVEKLATDPQGFVEGSAGYINSTGRLIFTYEEPPELPALGGPSATFIPLQLMSKPAGATVYLIPLFESESNPAIYREESALQYCEVGEGLTDVSTTVLEKIYMAVFLRKGQRKVLKADVLQKAGTNRVEAVFAE
jgi:hypothetical protein